MAVQTSANLTGNKNYSKLSCYYAEKMYEQIYTFAFIQIFECVCIYVELPSVPSMNLILTKSKQINNFLYFPGPVTPPHC